MSSHSGSPSRAPLDGVIVVDASRMLPGAVLARSLIDLGARLIKIEDPGRGDPLRMTPPHVSGIGVGYCVFFRGAESITLDLRTSTGVDALHTLIQQADVFIESFRPGTLARWGFDLDGCEEANPGLISMRLPAAEDDPKATGHDLNFMALTGLLQLLVGGNDGPWTIPPVQIADVSAAMLATSSVLAALLARERHGGGCRLAQPLLSGPLPFLVWPWAEEATGDPGLPALLTGGVPSYRIYLCGDGQPLAVACLEPKLWLRLTELLDRPDLGGLGLDPGPRGAKAIKELSDILASRPLREWLDALEDSGLPVTPIHDLAAARREPSLERAGLLEDTPMPDGSHHRGPGPAILHLGRTPSAPAPQLDEHRASIIEQFGLEQLQSVE